jgi:hypothetical protein
MSGISVSCPTCKARLKIANKALAGRLVACPKCGGIVSVPGQGLSITDVKAPEVKTPDVKAPLTPFDEDFNLDALAAAASDTPASTPLALSPGETSRETRTTSIAAKLDIIAVAFPAAAQPTANGVLGAEPSVARPTPAEPSVAAINEVHPTPAKSAFTQPTAAESTRAESTRAESSAAASNTAESPAIGPRGAEPSDAELPASEPATAASFLLWGGAGVGGGLLLAIGIFFAIAWLRGPPERQQAKLPDDMSSEQVVGANSPPGTSPDGDASSGLSTPGAASNRSDTPSLPTNSDPASTNTAGTMPAGGGPGKADRPVASSASPATTTAANSSANSSETPPKNPLAGSNASPAVKLNVAPVTQAASKTSAGESGAEAPPEFAPLESEGATPGKSAGPVPVAGRFAGLFNEGVADTTTPASVVATRPRTQGGDPASSVPSDEEIRRPRPREIDLAARMADPLQKLRVQEMALLDFTRFMSDLSTVPITLDADTLRFRRLSPRTAVSVEVEQSTVRDVLNAALSPFQLGLETGEGQARITDLSLLGAASKQRVHDVADLTGGDAQVASALGQWIRELVMPGTWVEDGGAGRLAPSPNALSIDHRDLAHHQVLFFCDKLRTARKLSPRGKFSPASLAVAAVPNRARSQLAAPIRLNFNRSTRFTQILERLGAVAGVTILVDWTALQAAGWTPETMAKLSVDGKSLSESLALLLVPRELTFRTVDETTLEVTTSAALVGHIEWELYPIRDLAASGAEALALIDQLRDVVAAEPIAAPNLETAMRWDDPSGAVFVALPEPHHKVIARCLSERRAASVVPATPMPTSTPAPMPVSTPAPTSVEKR